KTKEWSFTVLPVYILLVAVLGIVFNAFVLMVFCLHQKACTVAEIYLSNLAAADLLLTAFLPVWAVNASRKFNWPFSDSVCRLASLSINMNTYCSVYFLVLVSLDRYVALVHPLSHGRIRSPKYAKLGCVMVWGLGLLLSTPMLIYREVNYFSCVNITVCYVNYPNITVELLFDGVLTVFGFIIPISIISFCTVKIVHALNNRPTEGLNGQKSEHKATILVLAVLVAFLVCWVPFHLIRIVEMLLTAEVLTDCSLIAIQHECKQIFTYFAYFNSVFNPILYVIVGENFRKKVKELFKQRRNGVKISMTSTRSDLSRSVKTEHFSS
ncbi:B2 bradykinin receptor-like, partial [Pempheris klunzingeri]|uniref:B2 bradykinin receptor-like n=1 Tax=Pempheris klunzingeri TaxID=3127111 RepID=UPI003981415D